MKTPTACRATAVALLILAFLTGCATPKKAGEPAEKDISRIVTLADGTRCIEPAGLAQSRQKPGAIEFKAWVVSDLTEEEITTKANASNLQADEAEAVYFDSCRAYSNGTLSKQAFDKGRRLYFALRRQFFAQGVKQWQDKKNGIAEPGKLCLVILSGADSEHRSFTRVVPADSTVHDCAQLALANGSAEILLGCTQGHWEDRWATTPIALGKAASKLQQITAKGTSQAPDPDCGWN